jgi:hypothetical protein
LKIYDIILMSFGAEAGLDEGSSSYEQRGNNAVITRLSPAYHALFYLFTGGGSSVFGGVNANFGGWESKQERKEERKEERKKEKKKGEEKKEAA